MDKVYCLLIVYIIGSFLTGYLALGVIIIPIVAIVPIFYYYGIEAGILTGIATFFMTFKNYKGLKNILKEKEKKVYVLKDIR